MENRQAAERQQTQCKEGDGGARVTVLLQESVQYTGLATGSQPPVLFEVRRPTVWHRVLRRDAILWPASLRMPSFLPPLPGPERMPPLHETSTTWTCSRDIPASAAYLRVFVGAPRNIGRPWPAHGPTWGGRLQLNCSVKDQARMSWYSPSSNSSPSPVSLAPRGTLQIHVGSAFFFASSSCRFRFLDTRVDGAPSSS
jgi:hypothetical protein